MTALIVPTIGSTTLSACLAAVRALQPPPARVVVVCSGTAPPSASAVETVHCGERRGFAAAVNAGIETVLAEHQRVAILNDDAVPSPGWLGRLEAGLDRNAALAAVQGTIVDADDRVDGRGITFDRWLLPVQIDRGRPAGAERASASELTIPATSATAVLYRSSALRLLRLANGELFDSRFGSYHEDVDLGLRMMRAGWRAGWVADAQCRHLGSASGLTLRWRHPWWLLANRWRALAGNLQPAAMITILPRLLRGELRAVRLLLRSNPRTAAVALAVWTWLPVLLTAGWCRRSPGARLATLPRFEGRCTGQEQPA